MPDQGRLYLVTAPSGAGKTSLVRELLRSHPNLRFSISYTTRPKRPNESHACDYHFVNQLEFDHMVATGAFLEHARVFDYCYGTARRTVELELDRGHDLLLEIDWQGARQVRRVMPDVTSIFILPPTLAELRRRLQMRAEEERKRLVGPEQAATEAERRFRDAVADMSHWREFEYVVINDDFAQALAALVDILAGRGAASLPDRPAVHSVVAALLA